MEWNPHSLPKAVEIKATAINRLILSRK